MSSNLPWSAPPTHECVCGATIVRTESGVWIDPTAPVFRELCYPDASGRDGKAKHEPYERLVESNDN